MMIKVTTDDYPDIGYTKLTYREIAESYLELGMIEKISPTRVRLTESGKELLKAMDGTDEVDVVESVNLEEYIKMLEEEEKEYNEEDDD
jgi:hypothetical protein